MRTSSYYAILFGTYSLLNASLSFATFTKRPIPIWIQWLDAILICVIAFPLNLQPRLIAGWTTHSIFYVIVRVLRAYGYTLTATIMNGMQMLCAAVYTFYLFDRPIDRCIELVDDERSVPPATVGKDLVVDSVVEKH
jgi:hypothetical protein